MDKTDNEDVIDLSEPQENTPEHHNGPAHEQSQSNHSFIEDEPPGKPHLKSKKPLPHKRLIAWHRNLSKKQKIILLLVVLLLIGGAGYLAFKVRSNDSKPSTQVQQAAKKPDTVQSKLTGLQVKPEVNDRQVTGIMIENSPDARPQAGLKDAGVVFEAIAEGGITRFMALYQDTTSDYIGPVRSVRPYYLDWLLGFDSSIAHVGGSPEALAKVKTLNIKDLDQFANSGAYQRVRTRAAPHNVYTSIAALDELEAKKGFTKSDFTGFVRAKKEAKAATVDAKAINMNISSALFNVHYDYDAATNTYLRSEGGAPHIDERSKTQIAPKVVIALTMTRSQDGVYSVYGTTGQGAVTVYQNGTAITGTWNKKDAKTQLTFLDTAGKPIKLIPGQTWLTAVTAGTTSHTP